MRRDQTLVLAAAALSAVVVAAYAFSDDRSRSGFELVCRARARVIVYDPLAWTEYRKRLFARRHPGAVVTPNMYGALGGAVDGFEISDPYDRREDELAREYGGYDAIPMREIISSELRDDDYIIYRNGQLVAKVGSLLYLEPNFATHNAHSCLGDFPELYADRQRWRQARS